MIKLLSAARHSAAARVRQVWFLLFETNFERFKHSETTFELTQSYDYQCPDGIITADEEIAETAMWKEKSDDREARKTKVIAKSRREHRRAVQTGGHTARLVNTGGTARKLSLHEVATKLGAQVVGKAPKL